MRCLIAIKLTILMTIINCTIGNVTSYYWKNDTNIISSILREHDFNQNFFVSPLSIRIMLNILELINDVGYNYHIKNNLLNDKNLYNDNFYIRNKFFIDNKYEYIDYIIELIRSIPYAEYENLNFDDKIDSMQTINGWVYENSNGKLNDLIDLDELNEFINVLLINIIYFKMNWLYKFDRRLTRKDRFYLNNNYDYVDADMMLIENEFEYDNNFPHLNCDVIKIPYEDTKFNFIAIVPDDDQQLTDLQENILNHLPSLINFNADKVKVELMMPKFKFYKKINPKALLNQDDGGSANRQNNVTFKKFVDDVLQESYIEVNEDGAEAVAASSGIKRRTLNKIENEVYLNKPFAFLITAQSNHKDDVPKLIFYGNVMNPMDT